VSRYSVTAVRKITSVAQENGRCYVAGGSGGKRRRNSRVVAAVHQAGTAGSVRTPCRTAAETGRNQHAGIMVNSRQAACRRRQQVSGVKIPAQSSIQAVQAERSRRGRQRGCAGRQIRQACRRHEQVTQVGRRYVLAPCSRQASVARRRQAAMRRQYGGVQQVRSRKRRRQNVEHREVQQPRGQVSSRAGSGMRSYGASRRRNGSNLAAGSRR